MIVLLNEYDVRYLASCHSLDLNKFKTYLMDIGKGKENLIEIDWIYIKKLFPKLDRNYVSKYYSYQVLKEGSISSYFEGTSKQSHNYHLLNEIDFNHSNKNFKNYMEKYLDCLVLVGKKEGLYSIYTPIGKVREKELYLGYLDLNEMKKIESGNYFTLHNVKNGKRIVIRTIDKSLAENLIKTTLNYFNSLKNILYEA